MSPPSVLLVTSTRSAIEPLVHPPEAVQSARVRGIGVIDGAVLQYERAHSWPFTRVGRHVRAAHRGERDRASAALEGALAAVVVVDAARALLFLRELDVEVGVEVAVERGRPRERPAHTPLERMQ